MLLPRNYHSSQCCSFPKQRRSPPNRKPVRYGCGRAFWNLMEKGSRVPFFQGLTLDRRVIRRNGYKSDKGEERGGTRSWRDGPPSGEGSSALWAQGDHRHPIPVGRFPSRLSGTNLPPGLLVLESRKRPGELRFRFRTLGINRVSPGAPGVRSLSPARARTAG